MRNPSLILAGLLAVASLTACDESIKSPTFVPDLEVLRVCQAQAGTCPGPDTCSPRSATAPSVVPVGQTLQMCAWGRFEGLNSPDDDIFIPATWRNLTQQVVWSAEPAAAGLLSVNASGRVTGLAQSSALDVIATVPDDLSASTKVRVSAPVLESVQISPQGLQPSILVGSTVTHRCIGRYSADIACPETADPQSCDITAQSDFASSNAGVLTVNNTNAKGRGEAVAEGEAVVTCSAEGFTSVPGASYTVCSSDEVSSVEIVPVEGGTLPVPTLPVGQSTNLRLIATFPDCRDPDGEATITQDVTDRAEWTSDRPDVATAEAGEITAVAAGAANVTATFSGVTSDPVVINVLDPDDNFRLEVDGPTLLISGLALSAEYTLDQFIPFRNTNEEAGPFDVTDDPDTTWSSSAPMAINFPDPHDGTATVDEFAEPQTVTITATHKGVSVTYDTVIANGVASTVEVTPDFVCAGGLLTTVFVEYPFQVSSHAIVSPTDADGLPVLDPEGAEVTCSVDVTEFSGWQESQGPVLAEQILDLDMLFGDPFELQECEAAPGSISDDNASTPVVVDNAPGTKGQVTQNQNAMLNVAGSACINMDFQGLAGVSTWYVATDLLEPSLCSFAERNAEPSVGACADALRPPEEDEEEAR